MPGKVMKPVFVPAHLKIRRCANASICVSCQLSKHNEEQFLVERSCVNELIDVLPMVSRVYLAIAYAERPTLRYLLTQGAHIFTVTKWYESVVDTSVTECAPRSTRMLLEHAVNLSAATPVHWNQLSKAIFNRKLPEAQRLLAGGYELDMLCLYAATMWDLETFRWVWGRIPAALVSEDKYYLIFVLDTFNIYDKMEKLRLILARNDVDLHVERSGRAFSFFVSRAPTLIARKPGLVEIFAALHQRGLVLSNDDITNILSIPSMRWPRRMVAALLHIFKPNITRFHMQCGLRGGLYRYLLQYCANVDLEIALRAKIWELSTLQFHLKFFTPTVEQTGWIIDLIEKHSPSQALATAMLESVGNVKSLLELSRDRVRAVLFRLSRDQRDWIKYLHCLPETIIDIIWLRQPVNFKPCLDVYYRI